jgi:hypothetical protein
MQSIHALAVLLLLSAGIAHMAAAPKPLKMFTLAGQSNMEGQAVVDLVGQDYNRGEGTLPAKGEMFRHLTNAQGEWKKGDLGVNTARFRTNSVEGWTVLVHERLLAEEKSATEKALELLRGQLQEIVRVVPAPSVAKLREVTLWFSPEYPGVKPRAEYHPGAGWLRENGRDPAMVKAVEFTDVRNFEAETRRMPNFTLHELAHAFHDRVLQNGFGNPEIKTAFERARASKSYDRVERWFGNGRSNTVERAYAMTSPMEYFAETTEACFCSNDFYPFTRDELKEHDPAMFELLARLWVVTQ